MFEDFTTCMGQIMKKYIPILSLISLSFSAASMDISLLKDLDMSDRVKRQLLDSVELQQSIEQYKTQKGGGFATIGAGNDCDYRFGTTKIQDAIDANEAEIRVASDDTYNEDLEISDKSITIKGGYADCAAAVAGTQSGRTTITGITSGSPVVRILGLTQRNTIVLDSLQLTGGSGTGFFPGGGISTVTADAQVNLNNVHIVANTSDWGGGIAILAGDTDIYAVDTLILANSAEIGGGIYCQGDEASVILTGSSGIALSEATGVSGTANHGQGGAVFLKDACSFQINSGTAGGLLDFRGIGSNKATREGGGIYAEGGSIATLYGSQFCFSLGGPVFCIGQDNTNPVNLNNNQADSDNVDGESGGGAYITGANTVLNIYTGYVRDNITGSGGGNGGAVAVVDGAKLVINRFQKECWDQDHCSYFKANFAGNGYGGAIYNDASSVEIKHSVFEENRAEWGTAIYGINANSTTTIKGSIFNNNGDNGSGSYGDRQVFRVRDGAEIDVKHSTIADNNTVTSVFGIDSTSGGTSELYSSIVHDSSPVYAPSPGSIATDCDIVHETASIPGVTGYTIIDDPEFIDRANRDYHIDNNLSPAVDYCGGNSIDFKDMDFEDLGWDDPTVNNLYGPFDVGADETYGNDIIFKDGFE